MSIEASVIKIGELLVKARLLDTSDVIEAIQVSQRLQIPVGRVLIMSGTVSEQLLQASLQAQIVLNEGLVALDTACEALQIVAAERKTLQQALQQLNVAPDYQEELSNQIVDLLLDSKIVNQQQLDQAMQTSNEADIPLSGALVLQGILSANFFPSILRANDQICSGKMTREEAIEELKAAFIIWLKADESWNSLSDDFHRHFASSDELQSHDPQILSVTFDPDEVTLAATNSQSDHGPDTKVPSIPRVLDLFKQAGVCSQQEVQQRYDEMLDDPLLSGNVFRAMGLTDEQTLRFTLRCHSAIEKGVMTEEQAVRAIRAMRSGIVQEDELFEQHSKQDQEEGKERRSKTLRAIGGGFVGAVVAGIAFTKAFRGK